MVYGLQNCEEKSHSARIQKPVLAETDMGDVPVSVFMQQMLSVVHVYDNTNFRTC
jgi:hypothetical protein